MEQKTTDCRHELCETFSCRTVQWKGCLFARQKQQHKQNKMLREQTQQIDRYFNLNWFWLFPQRIHLWNQVRFMWRRLWKFSHRTLWSDAGRKWWQVFYFLRNITISCTINEYLTGYEPTMGRVSWMQMISENITCKYLWKSSPCMLDFRDEDVAVRKKNVLNSPHLRENRLKLWCCLRFQKVFDFKFNRRLLSKTTARNPPACDSL